MGALRNGHTNFYDSWLGSREGAPLPFGLQSLAGQWVVVWSRIPTLRPCDVMNTLDGEPFEAFFELQRRYVGASSDRQARFDDPGYERDALAAIKHYQQAPALVLDLRNNGGGNTPWRLAKALTGDGWSGLRPERDLASMSPLVRFVSRSVVALARVPRYKGRVYVLMNDGCASACKDLVGGLRGRPTVTLVGDTTYGSTGQPVFLEFGNGLRARVSARRYVTSSGAPFEGVGLVPDVWVSPTPAMLPGGEDLVLTRAVALARAAASKPVARRRGAR